MQRVKLVRDVDDERHDYDHVERERRADERPKLEAGQPTALVERQGAVGGTRRDIVDKVRVVRVVAAVVVLGEEVLLLATLRLVTVSVLGGVRLREGRLTPAARAAAAKSQEVRVSRSSLGSSPRSAQALERDTGSAHVPVRPRKRKGEMMGPGGRASLVSIVFRLAVRSADVSPLVLCVVTQVTPGRSAES